MDKGGMLGLVVVIVFGLCLLNLAGVQAGASENQKVGTVTKVDVEGKKVVVMVARELTFTVTENTKIHRGDNAKTLADIKEGAKVKVEYTRSGDVRTATDIAILPGEKQEKQEKKEKKSEGTQTKEGEVKKVDVEGKKVVVMVLRELTFTVIEKTKIHRGDEAKTLADIKEGAKVKVEYSRSGDVRTATNIAILTDEGK